MFHELKERERESRPLTSTQDLQQMLMLCFPSLLVSFSVTSLKLSAIKSLQMKDANSILYDHGWIFLLNRYVHPWKFQLDFPILFGHLEVWISSGMAGMADCNVRRGGDIRSNGKQSNSLKQDIRSCIACSSLLMHAGAYIFIVILSELYSI